MQKLLEMYFCGFFKARPETVLMKMDDGQIGIICYDDFGELRVGKVRRKEYIKQITDICKKINKFNGTRKAKYMGGQDEN